MIAEERTSQILTAADRRTVLTPVAIPNPASAAVLLVVLAIAIWSIWGIDASFSRLYRGIPHFIDFFADLWPPDRGHWTEMWPPIRDTIQMAVVGLIFSMIASMPLGLLAAKNTSPHPIAYNATRMFLNVVRAIPSLVWAIIVVASIGFGPF